MSPQNRVRLAGVIFFGALIAWPVTAFTVYKNEPQGVMALSWVGILLVAVVLWATTDVRREQDEEEEA
jgi:hypothetical protein